MNIDPRRLAVLLAVHRSGGVVAAADLLRITPSAVSQQISRLEKEVGCAVLERTPSGAVLTPAGMTLAHTAERIEQELDQAHVELLRHEGQVVGNLRVGAFKTVIRALLLPMMADLAAEQSGIVLSVWEVHEDEGRRDLRRGTLDLLILERDASVRVASPTDSNDLPLFDEPWYVVAPRTVPVPQTLSDLGHHRWLTAGPGTAASRAMQRLATTLDLTIDPAHRYLDYDVALAMVDAGLGSAVLPGLALQDNLPDSVTATYLPGLGVRRLVMRHRTTAAGPTPLMLAVYDLVRERAAALEVAGGPDSLGNGLLSSRPAQ